MIGFTLAADVGSSLTRVAARNRIRADETRAALDKANGSRVLAVGEKAGKLLNVNCVWPVRGCISDVTLAAIILRRFALELMRRRSLMGVGLRLGMPLSASPVELAAALDMGREAGFTSVRIVDSMLAGAEGAGVDIYGDTARIVADVGRERINIAAIANGCVILRTTVPFGSSAFDKQIQAYYAMEHNTLISLYAAERVKRALNRPSVRVHGRETWNGQPLMRAMRTATLREATEPTVRRIANELISFIGGLSPDTAADVYDNGIVLIGGGANMFGLAESLENKLEIPVVRALNADSAVIAGLQRCLKRPYIKSDQSMEIM